MIDLSPLVKEVQSVLNAWAQNLPDDKEGLIYEGLRHGGGLFVEVVTNPEPFEIQPQIRIGIHDPRLGSIYLDKFQFALLQ